MHLRSERTRCLTEKQNREKELKIAFKQTFSRNTLSQQEF